MGGDSEEPARRVSVLGDREISALVCITVVDWGPASILGLLPLRAFSRNEGRVVGSPSGEPGELLRRSNAFGTKRCCPIGVGLEWFLGCFLFGGKDGGCYGESLAPKVDFRGYGFIVAA